jgi:hypothetical protein
MKFAWSIAGLLLLPLAAAVTRTAWHLLLAMDPASGYLIPLPALALSAGFLAWLAAYRFLPRPVLSYVLAHELTHALWAALMGASVSRIRVGRRGGSVSLSKSNALITLAPYFFPLYAVLVILAYYVLSLFFDLRPYTLLWLALTGFAWGFHVTFTLQCLWEGQSDISVYGRLFSYTLIYLFNLLGIALWAVLVSDLTLDIFAARLAADLAAVGAGCRSGAAWIFRQATGHAAGP